jgi:hypothetical protein
VRAKFYCATPRCVRQWRNTTRRKCRTCGEPTRELKKLPDGVSGAYVIREFPEHESLAFGCVVKSRKHFRELQRIHGTQDWEPVREAPMFSKLRREGHAI